MEIVVGDRLLGNREAEAGLADTVVNVVMKPLIARCSNKGAIASFRNALLGSFPRC